MSQTLLEQTVFALDIQYGHYGTMPEGTREGLRSAEEHFADDPLGLAEFILKLMAHYARAVMRSAHKVYVVCNFRVLCQRVDDIIKAHLNNEPDKAARMYLSMGVACLGAKMFQWAEWALQKAEATRTPDNHELLNVILEVLSMVYARSCPEKVLPVLERHLTVRETLLRRSEGSDAVLDVEMRLRLARWCYTKNQYAMVRHWLQPVLAAMDAVTVAASAFCCAHGSDVSATAADSEISQDKARRCLERACQFDPGPFPHSIFMHGTVSGFSAGPKRSFARVLLENGQERMVLVSDLPGGTEEQQRDLDSWNTGMRIRACLVTLCEEMDDAELLSMRYCECGSPAVAGPTMVSFGNDSQHEQCLRGECTVCQSVSALVGAS